MCATKAWLVSSSFPASFASCCLFFLTAWPRIPLTHYILWQVLPFWLLLLFPKKTSSFEVQHLKFFALGVLSSAVCFLSLVQNHAPAFQELEFQLGSSALLARWDQDSQIAHLMWWCLRHPRRWVYLRYTTYSFPDPC